MVHLSSPLCAYVGSAGGEGGFVCSVESQMNLCKRPPFSSALCPLSTPQRNIPTALADHPLMHERRDKHACGWGPRV